MAAAAVPFMLGSAAVGAIGSIQAGRQANAAAQSEALRMEQQAGVTITDGMAQDEQQRRQARLMIGQQLAAGAEAGGGLNAEQLRQSVFDAELDSASIRYGVMSRASGLRDQARITRMQGKQAQRAGYLSAVGTLLQAGAMAYGMGGAGAKTPTTGDFARMDRALGY